MKYPLMGSVLLSNTTVCEASRLSMYSKDPDHQRHNSAAQIYALLVLIESVVLHDRIFYLPATLPEDVANLDLRNLLIENGILEVIRKREDHYIIGKALLSTFDTVEEFGSRRGGGRLSLEDFKPDLMRELKLNIGNERVPEDRNDLMQGGGRTSHAIQKAESFDEVARSLIAGIDYRGSGAYGSSMSMLRIMYYIFTSEHYGVPYLGISDSQLLLRKFPNYFQPSVRAKIYERLASGLRTTVEALAEEYRNSVIFIPPFSAIVLDRASAPTDIPAEVLALRTEYNSFRRKMRDLECNRLEANSLNDRMKALRQLQQLGNEVARPFEQPSQMKLDTALRYIPDVAALATNPTNPVQWAKSLIGMPTDMLLNWYRRRPVAKLLRTATAVSAMPSYDALLTKHFGGYTVAGFRNRLQDFKTSEPF